MKTTLILLALFFLSSVAFSDEVVVPDIQNHYSYYHGVHAVMKRSIENDSSLNTSQKITEYIKKFNALRDEFKHKRRAEYSAAYYTGKQGNSCTKGNSGGDPKICDKCIEARSNYYTRANWTGLYNEDGSSKNIPAIIRDEGLKACSYKKKSSRGRWYEEIQATFRLKNAYIEKSLADDEAWLFNKIAGEGS